MQAGEAVSNILYNTPTPSRQPFKRHILNTLVQNEPGVLSRVAGTLAARGFNIDSLVVCATEIRDLSRMCIVLRGQDGVVEQARRQLEDLVPVWAVLDYSDTKVIERELMLVKVSILGPEYFEESQYGAYSGGMGSGSSSHVPPELLAERQSGGREPSKAPANAANAVGAASEARSGAAAQPLTPSEALRVKNDNMRSVIALAEQFRGQVVDVSSNSVIVEMSGKTSRCDAFLKLVRPFGVLECARSGEYPACEGIESSHGDDTDNASCSRLFSAPLFRNYGPASIAHHIVMDRQRRADRRGAGRSGRLSPATWINLCLSCNGETSGRHKVYDGFGPCLRCCNVTQSIAHIHRRVKANAE
jgi:acetolactate synthase small subunit